MKQVYFTLYLFLSELPLLRFFYLDSDLQRLLATSIATDTDLIRAYVQIPPVSYPRALYGDFHPGF